MFFLKTVKNIWFVFPLVSLLAPLILTDLHDEAKVIDNGIEHKHTTKPL